jgi:hypothetical protein
MTTNSPEYELTDAIVALFRFDTELQALLFSLQPRIDENDDRVYSATAQLPDGPIREVLPRILIDAVGVPYPVEQRSADGSVPLAGVTIDLFTLVDADYRDLGEALHARERELMASTWMESSHIICGELVPLGPRNPVREVAFRNAWRLHHQFHAPLVGVI